MGLCDYIGWDSEIGEFNARNKSRERYAKREQVRIDALTALAMTWMKPFEYVFDQLC